MLFADGNVVDMADTEQNTCSSVEGHLFAWLDTVLGLTRLGREKKGRKGGKETEGEHRKGKGREFHHLGIWGD